MLFSAVSRKELISLNEWERLTRKAASIKQRYPKGTRIRLSRMEGEQDMPAGLEGTVAVVDDIGQIHMDWDNGRTLPLNVEQDSFTVLSRPEKKRDDPSR